MTNSIVSLICAGILSFFIVRFVSSLAKQIRIHRELAALEAEIKQAAATMSPQDFAKHIDGYLIRLEAYKQDWEPK